MDIHTVRQQLRTRSLYDLPLRVTYYARVSSESDEQLNSLGNQVQYYESPLAMAIKFSIPRPTPCGDFYDTDMFGGQFHAPLVNIEIPD